MRGNLSTASTCTGPSASSRSRVSSNASGGQGPAEVHTTLGSTPKMPAVDSPCGRTSRVLSRWSRRYASTGSTGGADRSAISTVTGRRRVPRRSSARASASKAGGEVASPGRRPSAGAGNHTSRIRPPSVTVARPSPQALVLTGSPYPSGPGRPGPPADLRRVVAPAAAGGTRPERYGGAVTTPALDLAADG